MADLKDAIAGLRRVTPENDPWQRGDLGGGGSPVDDHIATILNAVLSGDLIPTQCCMCGKVGLSVLEGDGGPECQLTDGRWVCSRECWERASGDLILKSDHDLAVAEAIRRAADVGKVVGDGHYGDEVHAAIHRIAPADALAEVQRLRAERDGLLRAAHDNHEADKRAEKAEAERAHEWRRRRDADASRDVARAACDTMRADRDAALARVEKLREARRDQMEARVEAVLRRNFVAPEDAAVEALCLRFGYGAVMDAASRLWARTDMLGAFYIGGCIGFRTEEEALAALDEDTRHG